MNDCADHHRSRLLASFRDAADGGRWASYGAKCVAMTRLKKPVTFETTFGVYSVDELLGEGGAGRVYGGAGPDGTPVAVKVLAAERASADKRGRFKNEISFLARNKHRNIVTVIDHGVARGGAIEGPFYVMRRYQGSLRHLVQGSISPDDVLLLFSQILDGVEAAHLQNVVHRDLKPENILYDRDSGTLAIADFGIARIGYPLHSSLAVGLVESASSTMVSYVAGPMATAC